MSKQLLNTIQEIAAARIGSGEALDVKQVCQDIASDVYMTVLWKLVTEEGTPSDAIRCVSIIQALQEWITANVVPDAILDDKKLSKALERGQKLLTELDERGTAEAKTEFGIPNEEIYTTSEGKKVAIGDMHPAYMANAFRKMLKQIRENAEMTDPLPDTP